MLAEARAPKGLIRCLSSSLSPPKKNHEKTMKIKEKSIQIKEKSIKNKEKLKKNKE